MGSSTWALGDSAVIKPGVTHPIADAALDGWQGRLIALEDEGATLVIQWDSLTLKSIPPAFIAQCEEWGTSWSAMRLTARDVLPAPARDTEEDVQAILPVLEAQYSWISLGEQGRRIRQIVKRTEASDRFASLRAWHAHLEEHLAVPFTACVEEYQRGPVPQGAQITVTRISLLDETYGTIVRIRYGRRIYHLPLHDLRASQAPAEVQQLVQDYAVWLTRRSSVSVRFPP
jgi:hypothetical protein